MSDTMYLVKNRSSSMVVYRIPEQNIRREFAVGEVKKISYKELLELSYQPGGRELMTHFLQIAPEVTKELNIHTEYEYNMSEQDIVKLIQTGSLDSFLDCLDFAPIGVIELVKQYAVKLPMTDTEKRRALMEKTGFNVDAAIKHNAEEAEEAKAASTSNSGRRVKIEEPVVEEKKEPVRRINITTETEVKE